jgi:hypothetical protein
MRARIYGRRMIVGPSARRGRQQRTRMHWYASITDPATGHVIWSDDCRDLSKLADEARRVAGASSIVAALGQTFRPWADIVDEAGEDL